VGYVFDGSLHTLLHMLLLLLPRENEKWDDSSTMKGGASRKCSDLMSSFPLPSQASKGPNFCHMVFSYVMFIRVVHSLSCLLVASLYEDKSKRPSLFCPFSPSSTLFVLSHFPLVYMLSLFQLFKPSIIFKPSMCILKGWLSISSSILSSISSNN
jgi:hypothetical protein